MTHASETVPPVRAGGETMPRAVIPGLPRPPVQPKPVLRAAEPAFLRAAMAPNTPSLTKPRLVTIVLAIRNRQLTYAREQG